MYKSRVLSFDRKSDRLNRIDPYPELFRIFFRLFVLEEALGQIL